MSAKKILGFIFSSLFILAFIFVTTWAIINFNKVKDGMSSTGVYTETDLNNAYNDGFNTGFKNKEEYDTLINSYRDTITIQTDEISKLNSKVNTLTSTNKVCEDTITNLTDEKELLEEQVENLTTIQSSNNQTISSLNTQITQLNNELNVLKNSDENKTEEITQKNLQITNLQNTINQLQKTNDLNLETITKLNNQISNLNSQITDMSNQIQNNNNNVLALNTKINELEKSVAYYEQYLASLENGTQVVATFEFNGSVYNIQVVAPNSILSVTTPTSTDYVVFNYWMKDNEKVDLSTYPITESTKFVANVTHNYDCKFISNNEEYNTQIVTKGSFPTLPTNPVLDGYEFDGWTTNGVDIVNPTTISVNQNTTYIAKFTKLHTVTFMYESEIVNTQTIRNGNYSTNVNVENTTYKTFNGWLLNNDLVNITNTPIYGDTVFTASITYSYDVNFIVDNETIENQIVTHNNYATEPTTVPEKNRYEFVGWSLDGVNVIDINNTPITNNTNFICVWTEKIGFDSNVYNTRMNGQFGVFNVNNYRAGVEFVSSNYDLILEDIETGIINSYDLPVNKSPKIHTYNNNLYFVFGGTDGTYCSLYKFDISSKQFILLVKKFEYSGYADICFKDNKLIIFSANLSQKYNSVAYYRIYDLSTEQDYSGSTAYPAVKISSDLYFGEINFTKFSLVGNYFVALVQDRSLKYSSGYANSLFVFNMNTESYNIVKLHYYNKSCYIYDSGEDLYIEYDNSTYALYDCKTNTLNDCSATEPVIYDYIFDKYKFSLNGLGSFTLNVVDNLGNEFTFTGSLNIYFIEKITDNIYRIYSFSEYVDLYL